MDIDSFLDGTTKIEVSNAGGELAELMKEVLGNKRKKR